MELLHPVSICFSQVAGEADHNIQYMFTLEMQKHSGCRAVELSWQHLWGSFMFLFLCRSEQKVLHLVSASENESFYVSVSGAALRGEKIVILVLSPGAFNPFLTVCNNLDTTSFKCRVSDILLTSSFVMCFARPIWHTLAVTLAEMHYRSYQWETIVRAHISMLFPCDLMLIQNPLIKPAACVADSKCLRGDNKKK